MPAAEFVKQAEAFSVGLHEAPPAPGFDAIMTPGEPEWRSRRRRTEEGIPVPDATNRAIIELAAELGAELS